MKSGLARLMRNQKGQLPVPLSVSGGRFSRGLSYNLGAGQQDRETMMRQFGLNGTIHSIVSLLAESSATPEWHLYKKQPVDGRRRYTTADQGSDQRTEVVQHAALSLWDKPNPFHSGFEFREASWQHLELTGETFWVLNRDAGFPTEMWYARPDRFEPVHDGQEYLTGWFYTGPDGSTTPLWADDVILEKYPDPLDPYRGAGPVSSIMPNIQQQRYATERQRNIFLNSADPGGIITVPNSLSEPEFEELIERWRESHRGVARANHVGVLEAGMTWTPGQTNRDMEYSNLRLQNRDEMREVWRVHPAMLGTTLDVNRANAQTAEEVFVAWQVLPRLNRRRSTLNSKLLPLFGSTGTGVEFDYEDPSPVNAETAATELLSKAQALQQLMLAGADFHDALEAVGLPDMGEAEKVPAPNFGPVTPSSDEQKVAAAPAELENRARLAITAAKDAAAKAFQQQSKDFPPEAIAWMHHAAWSGPVKVPLAHIDPAMQEMREVKSDLVAEFVKKIKAGKKLKPVILVKIPGDPELHLADGHHRYLASAEVDEPVRAFIGVVGARHGAWETMHEFEVTGSPKERADQLSSLLRRVLTDGYVPVELGGKYVRS